MARPRQHLHNAPIVEAVLDFKVLRKVQVSPDLFSDLEEKIGGGYERGLAVRLFQGYFGVDDGQLINPSQSQTDLGWRYQTPNEVAQFRVDGFTFSKIEPYTTWEKVFDEALRLWKIYCELAEPVQISRLAVRYINRMQLPATTEPSRYLEAPPSLPAPIPRSIREFLTRVYIDDEQSRASAVVVQALEPRVDPGSISILLDIDAFREVVLSPDDSSIPEIFEGLRRLKNTIFFASITEETLEMYA
jgi:uncharacterized protein (TIGR04255 family)